MLPAAVAVALTLIAAGIHACEQINATIGPDIGSDGPQLLHWLQDQGMAP